MKINLLCIFSLLFFKNQYSHAQTWTPIDPRTPYNVSAVYFLNDSVGFISGGIWSGPFGINSTFLKKTIDRGQHFIIVFDSSGMTPINQLYFYSEQYGLLKRWQDVINVTHDGGQSDSALVVTGCSSSGSYFQILDSNTIYLYEPNCNGNALGMSLDNGQTWTYNSAMSSIGANLTGNFLNPDTGIVYNGANVFTTFDRGMHWNIINSIPVNHVRCINESVAIMINNYSILRTPDFGNSWDTVYTGLRTLSLLENKDDFIVVCGDSGLVLKSYDLGSTWISEPAPTTEYLTGISIVDAFHEIFYLTGENGTMFRHVNLTAGIKEDTIMNRDIMPDIYFSGYQLKIVSTELSKSNFTLIDLPGRPLIKRSISGSENISITSLPAGIYIYLLENNGRFKTGKIFLE